MEVSLGRRWCDNECVVIPLSDSVERGGCPDAAGRPLTPGGPTANPCSASSSVFLPGAVLANRYRIERFVARGGMGEVYRAHDTDLDIRVALKTIRPEIASSPKALRRFKQEVLLARSVSHTNVCRIFDFGRHSHEGHDVSFLTMEFLAGETLSERIRTRGRFTRDEALPLVRQLADALDTAHRAGIVHQDFKSPNVMLIPSESGERAIITDFGLATTSGNPEAQSFLPATGGSTSVRTERAIGGDEEKTLQIHVGERAPSDRILEPSPLPVSPADGQPIPAMDTSEMPEPEPTSIVGTPEYMAPEQILGAPTGPAADLYSLGIVLFEMVTGTLPFKGSTPVEIATARITEDPPLPSSIHDVDPEWERVILRLLAREPGMRYARAGDAVLALEGRLPVAAGVRHSLPAERDAFVGRKKELETIASGLEDGTQLLTLHGPGGAGKTRLARRYGWTSLERWPGGVWFCDLSEARSIEGVASAVAMSLGVPLIRGDPVQQLGHAIAGRGRALIILDNFEQVASHAEATLGRWLGRAREAAFLVTSRERLRIEAETILDIEPLQPDTDAVELFARRARESRPDFAVTGSNRAMVAEVVRLLEGLPLAIELAAARLGTLSLEQLHARLDDRLRLLAGPRPGRRGALRATLDWSWELLRPWEQAALAQASVFEGGFTLEAAEAVLDLAPWPDAPSVLDIVQALLDKSWLRTQVVFEAPRFSMYVSLQEYASEKLRTEGAVAGTTTAPEAVARFEERHGEYFALFGAEEALEALGLRGGISRSKALCLEAGNLVAACRRALDRGSGETALGAFVALWTTLDLTGPFAVGVELGQALVAMGGLDPNQQARSRRFLSYALWRVGRLEEARRHAEEALIIHRQLGDRRLEGILLGDLGVYHNSMGRTEDARRHYEEALAIHREVGDHRQEGIVLGNLASLGLLQGRMEEARCRFEEALAVHRKVGNLRHEGVDMSNLGVLDMNQGRREEARQHFEDALAIHREIGNRRSQAFALGNLGLLQQEQGRLEEACRHYEEALSISREVGNRRHEGYVLASLGTLEEISGRMDEARRRYEQALAVHHDIGNRPQEGVTLGSLGLLEAREGRFAEARSLLARGEALLRELDYRVELGKILCSRGECERLAGDLAAAHAAINEAAALAQALRAEPDSRLARDLAKLRQALAGDRPETP